MDGEPENRRIVPRSASLGDDAQFDFVVGGGRIDAPAASGWGTGMGGPMDKSQILSALFPSRSGGAEDARDEDVGSMMPRLRLAAALLMDGTAAGDRLLELTLERAVAQAHTRPSAASLENWLVDLLDDTHESSGAALLL